MIRRLAPPPHSPSPAAPAASVALADRDHRDRRRRSAASSRDRPAGVQGHPLRRTAGRTAALAPAAAGRTVERSERDHHGRRSRLPACRASIPRPPQRRRLPGPRQRRLPDPRCVRPGPAPRKACAGDGVDLRRRQHRRRGLHSSQRRPLLRPRRRGAGGDELSAGRLGLLRPPGADRGGRPEGAASQLRPDGPDRGAEVGETQHRGLRRRPRQRHHLRRVGRRQRRADADGDAVCARPVPEGHSAVRRRLELGLRARGVEAGRCRGRRRCAGLRSSG